MGYIPTILQEMVRAVTQPFVLPSNSAAVSDGARIGTRGAFDLVIGDDLTDAAVLSYERARGVQQPEATFKNAIGLWDPPTQT